MTGRREKPLVQQGFKAGDNGKASKLARCNISEATAITPGDRLGLEPCVTSSIGLDGAKP